MAENTRTISLKCPNCASPLDISPDMEQFACGYCGSQQLVERRGGTIALKLVADAISKVQIGTDKTAAELALRRLSEEKTAVSANYDAQKQSLDTLVSNSSNSCIVSFFFYLISFTLFVLGVLICFTESAALGVLIILASLAAVTVTILVARSSKASARKERASIETQMASAQAELLRIEQETMKQRDVVEGRTGAP